VDASDQIKAQPVPRSTGSGADLARWAGFAGVREAGTDGALNGGTNGVDPMLVDLRGGVQQAPPKSGERDAIFGFLALAGALYSRQSA
jgi:hypothetical protein